MQSFLNMKDEGNQHEKAKEFFIPFCFGRRRPSNGFLLTFSLFPLSMRTQENGKYVVVTGV